MNSRKSTWALICPLTIGILFFSHINTLKAQEAGDTKSEIWKSLYIEYEVNKVWTAQLRTDLRYDYSEGAYSTFLGDLENSFEISKNLSGEIHYRYTSSFDGENRQRWAVQLSPDVGWKRWNLDGRVRWEWNIKDNDVDERLRVKINPEYDFGAVEIGVFTEWFIAEDGETEKMRYGLGWSYNIDKRHGIRFKTMSEHDDGENTLIVRAAYVYEIN